ncbi:hypothetical protein [Flavobacterium sp. ABG]|jgi:hypothetical protein|uniref:hypothetical protein n=1 Tax=Flavobacterium sp. ABG TaxID=1423322 RepID=UPI0006498FED|nr:hypothetical protein [Flavobacterium sp. ABG]KLT67916.1 hypothetical protein AB674_20005 [Flavobacterium sp. ABG]
MNLKTLNYIRNKAQLQELFMSQFTVNYIRKEINDIINETRKSATVGARLFAKNISTFEVIIFIDRNGVPDGFVLSEELKIKLDEYRKSFAKGKALQSQLLNAIL